MKQNKTNTPIVYKRDKNKVEINGDPEDVSKHVWFEQGSNLIKWIVLIISLASVLPNTGWLSFLWQLFKRQLPFLILFAAQVNSLSG
jgi:hypothetical protein